MDLLLLVLMVYVGVIAAGGWGLILARGFSEERVFFWVLAVSVVTFTGFLLVLFSLLRF